MMVLLASCLSCAGLDRPGKSYDVVDVFAGKACLSSTSRMAGLKAAALDLDYDGVVARKGGMNLCTPAGFALFVCSSEACNFVAAWACLCVFSSHLRLAVILILRSPLDLGLIMFGMCCSSFVAISRASTGRSILTPMGNTSYEKVRQANLLASRHSRLWKDFGFGVNICADIVLLTSSIGFIMGGPTKRRPILYGP